MSESRRLALFLPLSPDQPSVGARRGVGGEGLFGDPGPRPLRPRTLTLSRKGRGDRFTGKRDLSLEPRQASQTLIIQERREVSCSARHSISPHTSTGSKPSCGESIPRRSNGWPTSCTRRGRTAAACSSSATAARPARPRTCARTWARAPSARPTSATRPKRRLRVMSLTDNVGWLTALGNDCGYDQIFVQQLMNFGQPRRPGHRHQRLRQQPQRAGRRRLGQPPRTGDLRHDRLRRRQAPAGPAGRHPRPAERHGHGRGHPRLRASTGSSTTCTAGSTTAADTVVASG